MGKNYTKVKDGQVIKASGTRVCPHCGIEKPLAEFGFRRMESGGSIRNQSWCKDCRSSK
jgi:hypothetical protein